MNNQELIAEFLRQGLFVLGLFIGIVIVLVLVCAAALFVFRLAKNGRGKEPEPAATNQDIRDLLVLVRDEREKNITRDSELKQVLKICTDTLTSQSALNALVSRHIEHDSNVMDQLYSAVRKMPEQVQEFIQRAA